MTEDEKVARLRELAEEARVGIKGWDDLFRGRGWLTDADKLARGRLEGRAAAFDAAADIVAGVPV